MMTLEQADTLRSIKDVADILGIHPETIRVLIRADKLVKDVDYKVVGRSYMLLPSGVQAVKDRNTKPGPVSD